MQEEQGISMRQKEALSKAESAALFANKGQKNKDRPFCEHWKKGGHVESRCGNKFPKLNPHIKNEGAAPIFENRTEQDEKHVCFLGKYINASAPERSTDWFIDSGCSNHITHDKSSFLSYTPSKTVGTMEIGNGKVLRIVGSGHVKMELNVKGQSVPCKLKNALHVPKLG